MGVVAAKELKQIFADTKIDPKKDSLNQINLIVESYIKKSMKPLEKKIVIEEGIKPKVILIAGVNGVGKTTTIGKLGKIFSKDSKQVVLLQQIHLEQLLLSNWKFGQKKLVPK